MRKAGTTVYCYDANGNMTKRAGSTISYTSYNLPAVISSGSNSSTLSYGAWRNRYKQVAVNAGATETTIYVAGLLEQVTRGSLVEYRHLIAGANGTAAIHTRRTGGTPASDTVYVHTDHLGSPELFTNSSGAALVRPSFTAYGARRDGNDWAGGPSAGDLTAIGNVTRHGFTGHEHLDAVGLIHMNGRVYDPVAGRFLGVDPIIAIGISQSPNSYSYVWNNPLTYVDPSGLHVCESDRGRGGDNGQDAQEGEDGQSFEFGDLEVCNSSRPRPRPPRDIPEPKSGPPTGGHSGDGSNRSRNTGELATVGTTFCEFLQSWADSDAFGIAPIGGEGQVFVFALSGVGGYELGINSHGQIFGSVYGALGPGIGLGVTLLDPGISVGNQGQLPTNFSTADGTMIWASGGAGGGIGGSLFLDNHGGGSVGVGRIRAGLGAGGGIAAGDGGSLTMASPSIPDFLLSKFCSN